MDDNYAVAEAKSESSDSVHCTRHSIDVGCSELKIAAYRVFRAHAVEVTVAIVWVAHFLCGSMQIYSICNFDTRVDKVLKEEVPVVFPMFAMILYTRRSVDQQKPCRPTISFLNLSRNRELSSMRSLKLMNKCWQLWSIMDSWQRVPNTDRRDEE